MPKIKVLDTEIEVPEEIYFLLKKEAAEYQWDLDQFLDVHLGLKWRGHLNDCADTFFSLADVLKIDARDLACRYWIELKKRDDSFGFKMPIRNEEINRPTDQERKRPVTEDGEILNNESFGIDELSDAVDTSNLNRKALETLLNNVAGMHLPKLMSEVYEFLSEFEAGAIDNLLEAFTYGKSLPMKEAFYFLSGVHAMRQLSQETE